MIQITILTDYKGYFGHKQKTPFYGSGMNQRLLKKYFHTKNINIEYINFSEVCFSDDWNNKIVLYTSSEDKGYYYKDYIEDVIYGLECCSAKVIPSFQFLRANNNKVFMEIYRNMLFPDDQIQTFHFGTLEELKGFEKNLSYPLIIKEAKGAMSKGVFLARNSKELYRYVKKVSDTPNLKFKLWETAKYIRRNGRIKISSTNRNKFVIQNFIEDLDGDFKVLVYGEKYYILKRKNRKNDFRASGSGIFSISKIPETDILDFACKCFDKMHVPNVSLDIGKNDKGCFLLEYQAIHFGTKTQELSSGYFIKQDNNWTFVDQKLDLEQVYVDSIHKFLTDDESSIY